MYAEFARFYDRVEGDVPSTFARWVIRRLTAHRIEVGSVLELGCGTGAVLEALPATWTRTGVDRSVAMLDQVRAKGLDARWVQGDLTSIALGERFDLVLCVFDTLNHVLDPVGWAEAFAVARAHLAVGGVLAFDVHTTGRLRTLAADRAVVRTLADDTVIIDVRDAGDRYVWDIVIFERDGERYLRHHETIEEIALPLRQIRRLVTDAGFRVLEVLDPVGARATDDAPRAFWICRAV